MVAVATHPTRAADGLDEFRATRARTLAMLNGLTQEQLDFAPAPNRWSVAEVLDHMVLAGDLNRKQIARLVALKRTGQTPTLDLSFADLNISIAYLPRSVLPLLELPLMFMNKLVPDSLRNFLTRHRVVPFQNPDVAAPRRGRPAFQLSHDLITSLNETEILFANNCDIDYGELSLRHPLLGSYNVPGLLRFMAAHEQRHQSQINNIIASPQFPRPPYGGNGGPDVEH
jgi:DinB superfamily